MVFALGAAVAATLCVWFSFEENITDAAPVVRVSASGLYIKEVIMANCTSDFGSHKHRSRANALAHYLKMG